MNDVGDCCCTQFLIENQSNFKRSGVPARFMYYENGSWVDFSHEFFHLIHSGFLEGQPMIEAETQSCRFVFDFYRMLQIEIDTGNQRSIAWIDVNNNCFFPKSFVTGEFKDVHFNKRKRDYVENSEGSSSNDVSKKKKIISSSVSPRWPKAKLLKESEKAYLVVKKLFLSWLGVVEPGATITNIHQCMRSGPLDKARYEVFQKQMEITKAARGEPNMTFAWHGTSAKNVASILTHGFGMPTKITNHETLGVGIYLSPVRSSHMSAMSSEVDENGEKHVLLCRVILGRCEKVESGSQQLYPSSVDFDTGVDDVNNPKRYVVWCANMNTHILPECVVSYKSSKCLPGQLNGSAFSKSVSNASNTVITDLLSKLGSSLPSSKVRELQSFCSTYKGGEVAKETFMRGLQSIVGDDKLLSTIREIRG